jgi:two-component system, cell cycle response regulator
MENTNTGVVPRSASEGRRPYLLVIAGAQVGELHKLTEERTVVGRGPSAHLRLVADGVSREHAELVVDGARLTVRDVGSTNGTFVNGARAVARELRDGDKISIGRATLLVFTHQDGIESDYQRGRARGAGRDPATSAWKRDVFLERLAEEISYARRHGAPLTLLVWELDGYAAIEDRLGPSASATIVAAAAREASRSLADDDLLALLAPGRFAVACRDTAPEAARARAERVRAAIAAVPFVTTAPNASTLRLTVSVGGAPCGPGKDRGDLASAALMRAASDALARAISEGGDRVELLGAGAEDP